MIEFFQSLKIKARAVNNKILKKPLNGTYSVSVQVVLFSRDHTQVCLVLEKGGMKQKHLFSFFKERAWANPGGSVHQGEIPIEGLFREVFQETGFPKEALNINPIPIDHIIEGNDGNEHHKMVFIGEILCDPNEYPFEVNPAGDTIERRFVSISDLPSPKAQKFWRLGENGIFRTHLHYILANQRPAL